MSARIALALYRFGWWSNGVLFRLALRFDREAIYRAAMDTSRDLLDGAADAFVQAGESHRLVEAAQRRMAR